MGEQMQAPGDFRDGLYARYASTFKGQRRAAPTDAAFAWWDHKYLPLLRDVPRAAPVLEIGCGTGALLAYLERRGFSHATGLDISAEQVALARARGVPAEHADVFEYLPRQPGTFAAIVAIDVLEHFTRDELVRLAPLLAGALQPGGRLLIQTANGAGLFPGQVAYGDLTHLTIFTPESLAQLLRPCGFRNYFFDETGPIPVRLRGKVDVVLWRLMTALASTARRIETGKHQTIWTENFICLARC